MLFNMLNVQQQYILYAHSSMPVDVASLFRQDKTHKHCYVSSRVVMTKLLFMYSLEILNNLEYNILGKLLF